MPPRNKVSGAAVADAPVTEKPVDGSAPGVNGESVPKTQKVKVEKPPKPEVVYAPPIEPLTKVVYPFVSVTICGTPEQHGMAEDKITAIKEALAAVGLDGLIGYSEPLTAADAMGLIGWEVELKDGPKFGDDFSLRDYYEKKVRLHKNIRNRPIYPNNLDSLQQTILMGQWELNGEPTIISDVGNVQDNQHTLVSLIIAQQRLEYEKDSSGNLKWKDKWPIGIVSIPKVIVYGIKGTDAVVNSMNTGKPRTFGDVLYRSPYFSTLPLKAKDGVDRQTAARVTDHAVKDVWQRTGLYLDGYSARLTNSEGSAWIESHGGMEGKFLECVKHILEQDTHGHISNYIQCGKATCLMWLGACGKSDEGKYYSLRNEDHDAAAYASLKWHHWKEAISFWTEFGDREPDKVVNSGKDNEYTVSGKARGPLKALTDLLEEMNKSDEPMVREKDFVIAKAWNLWLEEKPITPAGIKIKDSDYEEADKVSGVRHLKKRNHQRFGSLDLGMDRLRPTKEIPQPQREAAENGIKDIKAKNLEELADSSGRVDADVPATSSQLGSIKPQTQQDCEILQAANPHINVLLVKSLSGKMELWGPAVDEVAKLMQVDVKVHPNDSKYLKFGVDEWEAVSDKVTDSGYVVGLGDKIDGKLEVVMESRPKAKNGGAGRR